jgi:AcrR family transcriptional regulator
MFGSSDDISPAELRSIPVPVLREFVMQAVETTSVREIATRMGIGRTTLHSFLTAGTSPHPRVRRLLALWYVSERGAPQVDYDLCFEILRGLPSDRQDEAVAELADFVRELYRKYRQPPEAAQTPEPEQKEASPGRSWIEEEPWRIID